MQWNFRAVKCTHRSMATNRRGSSKDAAAPGRGIEDANRRLLERLHRRFPGPFGTEEATRELRLEPGRGRRLLAYLAERGWLARVRRGWYVTVPPGRPRAPRMARRLLASRGSGARARLRRRLECLRALGPDAPVIG